MFKHITRLAARGTVLSVVVVTIAVGVGTPATATATGGFGMHVSTCAQASGFSANHNPGMHQGFHGWDPAHTC